MFTPMVNILPEKQETDNFILEHFKLTTNEALMVMIRDRISTSAGDFVRLRRKDGFRDVVMSDTLHERRTNIEVVRRAEGDVLVAGFGIGMILVPMLLNPKVTSITVVEISPEVPGMVLPYLPNKEKLSVIYADIMEWEPPRGKKWDIIYFDIWDHISGRNYEQMKILHHRFTRKKRIWMESWCRHQCKKLAKES